MAMGTTVFRIRIELIFRRCWNPVTLSRSCRGRRGLRSAPIPCEYPPKPNAAATQKRSFHTDESEEAVRTAYVAAEMKRIVADEDPHRRRGRPFDRLVHRSLHFSFAFGARTNTLPCPNTVFNSE